MKRKDIEICRRLHKKHGNSYYFATKFFPKHIRHATYALYAFFRIPDEIVDNPEVSNPDLVKKELFLWQDKWNQAYKTQQSDEPVLRATAEVFHTYGIPFEYSEAFLDAMIQDTSKSRYETYQELEHYMYGSAAVVGLMMTHVIGFRSQKALEYAKQLGYAMQLTNFLRDIDEDYLQRDRIYLPQEDLARFELSDRDIQKQKASKDFQKMMKFQIKRTRKLYDESEQGIELLSKEGQFAVRAASILYGAILGKIEQADYDIFNKRVSTSFWEKLMLLKKAL